MRSSSAGRNSPILDTANRLSALSIVIDDFDSTGRSLNSKELKVSSPEMAAPPPPPPPAPKPYTRQSSDASIKKILEEAEHRKHEFWKLIDEHSAVIENLKRIEQLENNTICKMPQSPIRT